MTPRALYATATRLALFLLLLLTPLAARAQTEALRPAFLTVSVNGQPRADSAKFLQGPGGALYASAVALGEWRIRLPEGEPLRFEGDLYYRISSIPGLRVNFSEADQSIEIVAGPGTFERQQVALTGQEAPAMTAPSAGAYLSYDVFAERNGSRTSVSGAFDAAIFTRHGVGSASIIASAGGGRTKLVRLETAWTIDRPGKMTSLRIGDSISLAGPGAAPVRFAGLHYYRNFAVQPGFITMPLPATQGSATVPSVVDIYVNNVLQSSREIAPGPFELTNIPVQTGRGTVQLVVRDLLGREIVSEQPYYASLRLLRRNLHDFSWEAGFIRRDFGFRSNRYGAFMASATHRYGLTDNFTVEGTAQISKSLQMAGFSLASLASNFGQFDFSGSLSHSRKGVGYRIAASTERATRTLSFGLRTEYQSGNYAYLGMSQTVLPPRFTAQAYANLPVRRGSLGLNVFYRDLRDRPDESLAGMFASFQVSRTVSLHAFARTAFVGPRNTALGLNLAFALGGRRSAAAGLERKPDGIAGYASFQSDPPAGPGGGYRVSASLGAIRTAEASYLHNLPMATLGAQVSHASGRTGVRLSARGSLGFMGGDVFASRDLGPSFAVVEVPGFAGVRVYADNQPVGVTGRSGKLVVPRLRAFEPNVLRIDEADLPLDASIDATEIIVSPYARSGTAVRFPVRSERGVLMQVRLEDGRALPAGARVWPQAGGVETVAVSGGMVYAPAVTGRVEFSASWEGERCAFTAQVPDNDDPQPRLDNLICRRTPTYAAH